MISYLLKCWEKPGFFSVCGRCHLTRFLSCGCVASPKMRWCNCPEDFD